MNSTKTLPETVGRLVAARPLRQLARDLAERRAATASGLWGSSLAAVTAAIEAELARPVLVVCGHVDEADDLADDMELFHGRRPEVVPALELSAGLGRVSEELVAARMQLITRLIAESTSESAQPRLLVCPIQSLMQSVPSRKQIDELTLTLKPGQQLDSQKLIVWLSEHGYNRLDQVEVPGDFAVRGGIIDVYLPGEFAEAGDQIGLTVRVDFFDDQIETISTFDLAGLGSQGKLQSVQMMD
jgi:transcription-repair coupling factor (superfamily II helicase)